MKITIIGAGFVGQAAGKGFLTKGHDVTFVDINLETVNYLKNKKLKALTLKDLINRGIDANIIFFTVQTPTLKTGVDLKYLKNAIKNTLKNLVPGKKLPLFVIKSTIPPGTTEEVLIPFFEKKLNKKAGKDFDIYVNPEFLRQKKALSDFLKPKLVIIGELRKNSTAILKELYKDFNTNIYVLDLKEAEMMKYVHNLFNALKISFFNELRLASKTSKINIDKIFPLVTQSAEGIWNPAYGIYDLGLLNGSCLPKDTLAFKSWAKSKNIQLPLIEAIIKSNKLKIL